MFFQVLLYCDWCDLKKHIGDRALLSRKSDYHNLAKTITHIEDKNLKGHQGLYLNIW